MKSRAIMVTAAVFGAAATILPVAAVAASPGANLTIRHQVKGCHMWSLNGGKYGVSQVVKLSRGGSLTITDNDMMPHLLVQQGGAAVSERLVKPGSLSMGKLKAPYATGLMPHMGATLSVKFTKPGVYKFRTKTLGDYMPIKTVGEDNVLRVTVVVS